MRILKIRKFDIRSLSLRTHEYIFVEIPGTRKSFSASKKLKFAKLNGNREARRHVEVSELNIRL